MVGFVQQNFLSTFYGWLAGVVISVVLCVPDWPIFNRNPVSWLSEVPPSGGKKDSDKKDKSGGGAALDDKKAKASDSKSKSKKTKKS